VKTDKHGIVDDVLWCADAGVRMRRRMKMLTRKMRTLHISRQARNQRRRAVRRTATSPTGLLRMKTPVCAAFLVAVVY